MSSTKLTTKAAELKARQYVAANFKDLPSTAFVMPRKYIAEEQRRNFEVRYADLNFHEVYVLVIVSVKDDGEVELKKDRRESVRKQLKAKGLNLPDASFIPPSLPQQFMDALEEPNANFPEWYVRVVLQSDANFDAIATIRKSDGSGIDFPLLLFRTNSDKANFFSSYTGDPSTRIGLVIPAAATPADVRKRLVDQLTSRRKLYDGPA